MKTYQSFCDVSLGESFFNDPRSYFNSLIRNVEAFVAAKYAAEEFNVRQLAVLSPDQRIRLAKELHFRYPGNENPHSQTGARASHNIMIDSA